MTLLEAAKIPQVRRSTRTWIECPNCGIMHHISDRAERNIRLGRRTARCDRCRDEVLLEVTQADYDFWMGQFTDDEIVFMAEAMWGPRVRWDEGWREGFLFVRNA